MESSSTNINISIDELPDNVVIYRFEDDDFIFIDCNKNAQKTENISKDELLGKKLTKVFPGVKKFGLFDILLQVYKDSKPRELDAKLYKDARISGWRHNNVKKLQNGDIVVFYKDVSKYKEQDKKVTLLAKALQQTDDIVLITDEDGIIEYVNDSLILKSGYSENELLGHKTNIFKSTKQDKKFYKNLWNTILSGKNYHGILINRAKNSTLYYVDMNITPIFDEKNKIRNFVATSTDITNRIEIENRLKKLATVDSLTKIYNRYKINEEIDIKIARYRRYKNPFALVMFDIDFFKHVNDTYGHSIGDKVLRALSKLVLKNIREVDLFGRWGGEEFMLVLDNTTKYEALTIAEKIRKLVGEHMIDGKYTITISLGVVEFKEDEAKRELLKRVDNALYKAKQNGRNLVVVE